MVIKVTKENFESVVLKNEKTVMLDFYATWCGPCQMVSPIVDEIANENPQYAVCKIDVDEEMEIAGQFGIVSIPTVVCIKNGEVTGKVVGYVPKDKLLSIME